MTNKSPTESMRDLIQLLESQTNLQEIGPVGRAIGAAAMGLAGLTGSPSSTAAMGTDRQIAATTQAQTSEAVQANQAFNNWVKQMRELTQVLPTLSRGDTGLAARLNQVAANMNEQLDDMEKVWNNQDPLRPVNPNLDWIKWVQQLQSQPHQVQATAQNLYLANMHVTILHGILHRLAVARRQSNEHERLDRESEQRLDSLNQLLGRR
jgi:hypothetical protein